MRLFTSTVLSLGLALVAACSSSGSESGNSNSASSTSLLVDTGAGGGYALEARVDVLAFERVDGSFTDNVLPTSATLALARPSAASAGVNLPAVPAGTYVALRLLLAENGVTALGSDGRAENVTPTVRDVRVPFAAPTLLSDGGVRWLVLNHNGAPAITRDAAGRLTWQPSLVTRLGDVQPLHDVVVTVAAIEGDHLIGTLSSAGGMSVRGRLSDDSSLSDDSGSRDRAGFLRDSRSGDDLLCDGVLSHDGSLHLGRAHRRSRSSADESKLYGQIVELLPSVPALRVQVQELVRGGVGIGTPLPVLTVRTGSAQIHRSGVRSLRLDFSAFAVGQRVEVEWRGAVADNTITAHEVAIEDGAGSGISHESEGQVAAIDLAQNTIVAVPRSDDPLIVGGQRVSQATVVLSASTVIVREVDGDRRSATLAEARVGDRIWFWGRAVEPQRVQATAVRLRAAR